MMDEHDRAIINAYQGGFPICANPYQVAGEPLGIAAEAMLGRVNALVENGTLSRFGPLYNAEKLGGAVTLAGMQVPKARFEAVAALVNAHPEVSQNYERHHALNMWFVISTEKETRIAEVIAAIEAETGLKVYNMPKLDEYFIGLRLTV